MAVSITRAHLRTSKTKTYNIDLSENTAKINPNTIESNQTQCLILSLTQQCNTIMK